MAETVDLLLTSFFVPLREGRKGGRRKRQIIVFKPGYRPSAAVVADLGGEVIKELPLINGVVGLFPVSISSRVLAAHPEILRVDEDLPAQIVPGGVFPLLLLFLLLSSWFAQSGQQTGDAIPWGVEMVRAPQIWFLTRGEGVKVAVIDTEVDLQHPDLAPNLRPGFNAVENQKPPQDRNGHGTHVAGIIGAVDDNRGLVGVSPRVELYPVKALNDQGHGWLSDIIAGMQWCIENGIQIVNMSFALHGENESLRDTILRADRAGILLVVAAGNSGPGENSVQFPACYPETVAVTALNRRQRLASFSSRGAEVDLTAPGAEIASLWPGGGTRSLNGTSMAAPHVTGVAALVLSARGAASPDRLKEHLKRTARRLPYLKETEQGAGLVDARAALLGS